MPAIRLLLAAMLLAVAPLHASAQTPVVAAPVTATTDAKPSDAKPAKPTRAERRARKNEEIAREKAAVATPHDAQAAMEIRMKTKEKRAACRDEAKAKGIGIMKRRAFVKECEAG